MSTRSKRMMLAATLAVAGLAVLLGRVTAQEAATAPQAPAVVRTAVCNANDVLRDYRGILETAKALDEEKKNLSAEEERRRREVETMQQQLGALKAGSEAFQAKQAELEEKLVALKVWGEVQLVHRKRRAAESIEQAYYLMGETINALAAERGLHLVLNLNEPNLANLQPDEMQAKIVAQRVLCYTASIDITAEVVARMNAAYARTGAPAATGTGQPQTQP